MRSFSAQVTALLVALPLGGLTAVPANAAVHERPRVALGDSFTAHGGTQDESEACLNGSLAYPKSAKSDHEGFNEIDLVSDIPGRAEATDPRLVNPWGLSAAPGGPIWVSDNGTAKATVYSGALPGQPVGIVSTVVSIPGQGAPTGQAFNDTHDFKIGSDATKRPAKVIFAGEEGDISAWNPDVSATDAILVAHTDNAVYKGLALLRENNNNNDDNNDPLVHGNRWEPRLLAANFRAGRVDVFDGRFSLLPPGGEFQDPDIPAGFAPFNVVVIDRSVFVTYAKQSADKHDDVAGPGNGFIDEFDRAGRLVRRFADDDVLNSPWGIVLAPSDFGAFSCKLLVGNFGDGRINVFDRESASVEGQLTRPDGTEIVIPGLWGLLRGTKAAGGRGAVWFAAGINDEKDGLLGILRAAS
jgi:uncharacterized protein (TIGR03118 family)